MGVREGCTGASTSMKAAVVLLVAANFFSWIAFTTSSWRYVESDVNHNPGQGLWRSCTETGTFTCGLLDGTRLGWYGTFQAFGIFGFVSLTVALLLVVLFLFVASCSDNVEVKAAAKVLCFVGGLCWIIAVFIFSVKYKDDANSQDHDKLGFSFVFAIITALLAIVSGLLLLKADSAVSVPPPA